MMKPISLALCLLTLACGAAAQTPGTVAGLHPDRRPDGAPQVTQGEWTAEQLRQALRGIEGVPPGNVETIAATGRWWAPLRGPGMHPPYDLRGWHQQEGAGPAR